jgi:predicted kinase
MATAHLIYGYLGSGKTTFAKQLERNLPGIRFNCDEWVTALSDEVPPVRLVQKHQDVISAMVKQYWPRCLELGIDVILDDGFWRRESRDEARAKAASVGADCKLYYLNCPLELAWKRVEKRNNDLDGSFFFNRLGFETLRQHFEPLGPDEEHVEICLT